MSRAIALSLAVLAFLVVVIGGSWGYRYYTAEIRGKIDAHEQILSGNNRINAYNHFYNLCASVQKAESAIDAQLALLDSEGADKERVNINIAGQQTARTNGILQYNVDAKKDYTIGQFRDLGLPYELDLFVYPDEHGRRTECGT